MGMFSGRTKYCSKIQENKRMNRDESKKWSREHKIEVKLETTKLEKHSSFLIVLSILCIALAFGLPLPFMSKGLAVLSLLLSLFLKYIARIRRTREEKELNKDLSMYAWDVGENPEIDSLSGEEVFFKIKNINQ